MRRRRLPTPFCRPACRPFSYASLYTRQGASGFNQPLSLDTSSVTGMSSMFSVRSARALPAAPIAGSSSPRAVACAAASPRLPATGPACHPSSDASLFDPTGRVFVQPAAEPRHVQRHKHGVHVSGALRACPGSKPHSWVLPARRLRRGHPTPSRLLTPHATLFLCLPFDSAGCKWFVRREQAPHPLCVVGQSGLGRFDLELFGCMLATSASASLPARLGAGTACPATSASPAVRGH